MNIGTLSTIHSFKPSLEDFTRIELLNKHVAELFSHTYIVHVHILTTIQQINGSYFIVRNDLGPNAQMCLFSTMVI
mgnify:CR=1 FL=1